MRRNAMARIRNIAERCLTCTAGPARMIRPRLPVYPAGAAPAGNLPGGSDVRTGAATPGCPHRSLLLPVIDRHAVAAAPVSASDIERLVGLPVNDLALFEQALTHRSRFRGQADTHLATNERLEFLGDALLGFIMAEELYTRFPEKNEGYLTRLRAKLVSRNALARYARRIDLGPHLLMSPNAEQSEGRDNPNILSDAYEALVGALYLDQGLTAARRFIKASALDPIDLRALATQNENYKSQLLEYAQARGRAQPTYRVVHAEGPSHDRTFTVEALLNGTAYGQGTAGSKKKAEQLAACEALDTLRETHGEPSTD